MTTVELNGKTYERKISYHAFLGDYAKIQGKYYKVKNNKAIREIYIKENQFNWELRQL